MPDRGDVCVLIPTLNEARTIGSVIDAFHENGYKNILVVDGHSTDDTRTIARDHDARVIEQSGTGKGRAVREGLTQIDHEIVLLVDGDGTYRATDAPTLLKPILDGAAEHVIGNRFANMEPNAMTRLNYVGNHLINHVFAVVHGENYRDILSGYRAFTKNSIDEFFLSADGFGIETELAVECAKHDVPTTVVPITYQSRPGGSQPNLRPIRDGGVILLTLYQLAKTNNPMFYFGSAGTLSILTGILIGLFVAARYLTRGITHEVLAIVSAFAVLFGLQLLMFGVLSDMLLALHRAQHQNTSERE